MLLSLSIIIFAGLMLGYVSNRIRLPAIVGMLVAGIVLGPHGLNVLDQSILAISSDLRKIALIIILAKAGLSLDIGDLKRIGRPAVLLCFVPASFEILAFLLFAPKLLGVSLVEAGILGAIMGAVSPAIVVPRLSYLIEEHWGTKKGIPQMILAGASADDVYNIVIFTMLIGMEKGGNISLLNFLKVPESIILGALLGAMIGLVLSWYFKTFHIRDSLKVTIIMAIGMALYYLEGILTGMIAISGLLAVMAIGLTINNRNAEVAKRLTGKFSRLWIAAEIFLFVLVGASVDIKYASQAGIMMIVMLLIGLAFRMLGVYISILGTTLTKKERLFCLLAELPKATVQAAIGGVPLSMGLPCGKLVLSFSVIAILITAPLGAKAIDASYKKLLTRDLEQA
ncbi:NhaP-type Na+/H+ or K+/H+ antiporter [Sharpea azabuensis]|uniref:cation:proton antiporter n=1 Tax=Sharpea azabuensis TaxID=322505 RepID=UPI0008EB2B82|nr:cation:proton antiporter [Sharpea azabuensis]SFD97867.1 NhaP-type Na+/H+ or K+/H+ antiporter [Sharpea azabuensis]SFK92078.1 NhaP-type Na+/H+ or K+/H+ antiporter [Sharpea azabuensis]